MFFREMGTVLFIDCPQQADNTVFVVRFAHSNWLTPTSQTPKLLSEEFTASPIPLSPIFSNPSYWAFMSVVLKYLKDSISECSEEYFKWKNLKVGFILMQFRVWDQ